MQVAPGEHYEDATSSGEKRPTGKVVGIIRRNWRTRGYAGSLMPDNTGRGARRGGANVLFCPVERRYPFIRIHTRQVSFDCLAACVPLSWHICAQAVSLSCGKANDVLLLRLVDAF